MNTDALDLRETGFGRHITIEVDCHNGLWTPDNFQLIEADQLRVILVGPQDNIDVYNRGVFPEGTKFIERPSDGFQTDVVIDETKGNVAKFQGWATDIRGLDADTIKLGTEILEALK